MIRLERSPLYGSVVALALTAVALLISLLLRPYLEPDIFLLFLVVVWLSAWYYGLTIGLVASGASALALLVFFFRAWPDSGRSACGLGRSWRSRASSSG